MQENNIFNKRINRFSNVSYKKEEYKLFDFNNNLKSDNFEDLEFTNYLSSNKCEKYSILLEICQSINKKNNNFNKYFIIDEFDSHRYNAKRVYDIIEKVNNKTIDRKTTIYKFKCNKDVEIQFYILKQKDILKLCLVDLYHIAIEATNQKIRKADRKGIYKARKKCSFNIKEIQKELHKISDKP